MNSEIGQVSLKETLQNLFNGGVDILVGKVVRTNPLQIKVESGGTLLLSDISTIIPAHVRPIEFGNSVYLLVVNNGKKFFVLGRE